VKIASNITNSKLADSHMHTKYTEPTIQSCKRHRTANATDSTTDMHCTNTANSAGRADRLSPLVKSTDTNADSNSVNVCTPVDLDIGNLLGVSTQNADATADTEAVAMLSATKPSPLLANRPSRLCQRPARYLSNVRLSSSLIGRIGAPFPIVLEVACCRLGSAHSESEVVVDVLTLRVLLLKNVVVLHLKHCKVVQKCCVDDIAHVKLSLRTRRTLVRGLRQVRPQRPMQVRL